MPCPIPRRAVSRYARAMVTLAPLPEIFLACAPGLEPLLRDEAAAAGFAAPTLQRGGVTIAGGWPDVWRANLVLRGATRVLARIGSFRALHLAQLDKRARKFPWAETLRPGCTIRVEATCTQSRIYHAGAATQRVETALREAFGATIAADAPLTLKVRIEDDLVTLSLDTSGESLHKRGHKAAVSKAPLRETLAALFLRAAGFRGEGPVVDPMCGSGTFALEAAEIAAGLWPGRDRAFAFEMLAGFDPAAFAALKASAPAPRPGPVTGYGFDRDPGAIRAATDNAARAGVADRTAFRQQVLSDLTPPDGPPGLVIVNPPYGARIGEKSDLFPLYGTLGKVLLTRFSGWRAAIVTTEGGLARATGLPLLPPGPVVDHGGLKVRLYQTTPLP